MAAVAVATVAAVMAGMAAAVVVAGTVAVTTSAAGTADTTTGALQRLEPQASSLAIGAATLHALWQLA